MSFKNNSGAKFVTRNFPNQNNVQQIQIKDIESMMDTFHDGPSPDAGEVLHICAAASRARF